MRNKINWGNVFWGVLIALNVAVFVSLVIEIEGHWLCGLGWLFAALHGLLYRIEESISDIQGRMVKRWEDECQKWHDTYLRMQREIATLKSELEKANAEENKD